MQLHATARPPAGRLALATVTAALAVTLTACGGSGSTTTHHTAAHAPAAPASSAPAAAAAAASASGLSGRWHGHYGGSYQGTFTLTWRQSGSNLSGRIHISNPSSSLPIHGTLSGSSIKFGTVGSYRITYTGTVSGSSMSGNWGLKGAVQGGGNWAAVKG